MQMCNAYWVGVAISYVFEVTIVDNFTCIVCVYKELYILPDKLYNSLVCTMELNIFYQVF